MANYILLILSIFLVVISHDQCYGSQSFRPLHKFLGLHSDSSDASSLSTSESFNTSNKAFSVFVSSQDGLKENDKIDKLAGQPDGVDFNQYSGYVNVDSDRALFYYFVESPNDASSKPLLMWFAGVPGCSSFEIGPWTEIGPFRVNADGKTLYRNPYAWNSEANLIFVEPCAGVGFSYSNTSSYYDHISNATIAYDAYTFLLNWLERFPEYKDRSLFLAAETSTQYATGLAQVILDQNQYSNQTKAINLQGIALWSSISLDYESSLYGWFDYAWTHALISDEVYFGAKSNCKISSTGLSSKCLEFVDLIADFTSKGINPYDIYGPLCNSTPGADQYSYIGPCSTDYASKYLDNLDVQYALHANFGNVTFRWKSCSNFRVGVYETTLEIMTKLMEMGIAQIWIFSGDTDSNSPVTSSKYAVQKLKLSVKTPWYAWYHQNEVGGYAVEYQNLTFVTARGAGHFVSNYQPAKALALFSSFINSKLPPSS